MLNRNAVNELIARYDVPKSTIGICAGVDSSQVTNYTKGAKVSSAVELAVGRAVEEIVAVIEKAKPIVPNLSDGIYMKSLIRRWRQEGSFVVALVSDDQTRYFCSHKNNTIFSTPLLLQGTALTKDLADLIADNLREKGSQAVVLTNPYASIEQRYDEMQDVWNEAVTA